MSSFMQIRPLAGEFHTDGGTDRRTDMTELIVDIRNFLNVPKTQFVPHRKHTKSQFRLQY